MDNGGGQQSVPQETTTNVINSTEVDPFTQQTRQDLINFARPILTGPGPFYYPGQLTAGFTPQQYAAQQATQELATDPGSYAVLGEYLPQMQGLSDFGLSYLQSPRFSSLVDQAQTTVSGLADPSERYVTTNPYLQDAMFAAFQPQVAAFTNQTLPSIRGTAIGAGQFGGSRQGIAEGLGASGLATSLGNTATNMAYQNYTDAANRQLMAAGMLPQMASLPLAGAMTGQSLVSNTANMHQAGMAQAFQNLAALDLVGQQRQGLAQSMINNEVQRYMFNNQMPLQKLQMYGNIVNGMSPLGQTSNQSSTGITNMPIPTTSPLNAALGGAALGFGLSSAVSSGVASGASWATGLPAFMANPAIGAAIGAGMFLLPSLF